MPPPPAKTEAAAPAAAGAKPEKNAPSAPPEPMALPPAAAASPGGLKAWAPVLVSLVGAPAVTWATIQFAVLPRLEKKLAVPAAAAAAAATDDSAAAAETKNGKPKEPSSYDFANVVVNLAGTMGTRYLKTSFHVLGDPKSDVDVAKLFQDNRTMLYDTTLNVLSSLTLADLEEPGAKNVIREKLVAAYNQALKKRVADQVYFYDFVVQ